MLRTYLRINRVGLVGAARLSPERTGKVGTAARPGSGDAVGRAAPGLLLPASPPRVMPSGDGKSPARQAVGGE